MKLKEFSDGWKHFCDCIDFGTQAMDAEAIKFMNEMPAAVMSGLSPDAPESEQNNEDRTLNPDPAADIFREFYRRETNRNSDPDTPEPAPESEKELEKPDDGSGLH